MGLIQRPSPTGFIAPAYDKPGEAASGNAVKEGVLEAMKFFTVVKTYSLPWPGP